MVRAGNLCIVDYRYFLSAGQAGADPSSQGKVTIHELGHSLGKKRVGVGVALASVCLQCWAHAQYVLPPFIGLLHPHSGVDFTSNTLDSALCLSGGAKTRQCRVPASDVVSQVCDSFWT